MSRIVISEASARLLLQTLQEKKEDLEEKLLDIKSEIEEVEKAMENPVAPLEKKATDLPPLTMRKIESVLKIANEETSCQDLADMLAIDLNLDVRDRAITKQLKNKVYQHCLQMVKKGIVYQTWNTNKACHVYGFVANYEQPVNA